MPFQRTNSNSFSNPILYEINTRCWLADLSEVAGKRITLATVPESELGHWRRLGFNQIWLMGVWTTGPLARAKALEDPGLRKAYGELLPDWTEADVTGSPYAIAEYRVSDSLGGEEGLAAFRRRLNDAGMSLILDFVGNHLGLDHQWIQTRPDLLVHTATEMPGAFVVDTGIGRRWIAHGRDPWFPPWADTVQVDYRSAAAREAMTEL